VTALIRAPTCYLLESFVIPVLQCQILPLMTIVHIVVWVLNLCLPACAIIACGATTACVRPSMGLMAYIFKLYIIRGAIFAGDCSQTDICMKTRVLYDLL